MVLIILENVVDDRSVTADIQKNSLLFVSNIVNRKRTVPAERPSQGLEDKGKTSRTLRVPSPDTRRPGAVSGGERFHTISPKKRNHFKTVLSHVLQGG